MTEGKTVEDLKLSTSCNSTNPKELLLNSGESQKEQRNGSAEHCNGFAERVPADEKVNGVIKEGPHGCNENLMVSKPLEQVNGALKEGLYATPLQQGCEALCEQKNEVSKQEEALHVDEREMAYRQGNWVFSEILILLEAKVKEQGLFCEGSKRSRPSADDKWKNVSEYCRSKGVQRTKEQCRIKWDNMMPDYRKIRDYEEQKETSAQSYFEMETWERRAKHLPSNMDVEVYQRIASILFNKPAKGGLSGLKREAREKRFSDPPPRSSSSLHAMVRSPNGADGSNGADLEGEGPALADLVGKHIAASAPRKRRRRRRAVESGLPENKVEPMIIIEPPESRDNSSTEDDTTVISSRSQQGAPTTAYLYAERSSFPSQHTDRNTFHSHQRMRFESRDPLPVAYRSSQNGHPHAASIVERGNSTSPFEGAEEKEASMHETINGVRSHDMVNHIEDRKDARHKELIALEREKLAVFREASFTIANAMTNAMAVFSKVAEDLLLRHR